MELHILEIIYSITDEWEWLPMRLPPYAMFSDHDIDVDDIAEILAELHKEYDFEVGRYPECIQDIIDLVMERPFRTDNMQTDSQQSSSAYDFSTIVHNNEHIEHSNKIYKLSTIPKLKLRMKRLFPFLSLLLLFSCSNDKQEAEPTHMVNISVSSLDADITRATLAEAAVTDLYAWEGSTLIKHQQSTDADFGSFTTSLTYGSHTLTFVASKADGQTWSSSQWSCSKVKDTFAKTLTFSVDGTTAGQSVELARRSTQVCFVIQDAIPSNVKTMHITADNCIALTSTLAGTSSQKYETSVDISDKVGSTTMRPVVNLLSSSPTDAEDIEVMIEFLDASNAVLYHYERTISVLPNRCTNIKGNYFTGSNSFSVNTTWLTSLDVNLFE